MRAPHSAVLLSVLSSLALVHAGTYHYYDQPAKRGLLDSLLGALDGNGDDQKKGKGQDGAVTVTETVKQTITVGAGAVAGFNGTAAVTQVETKTETQTVTVTEKAAAAGAAGDAAGQVYVLTRNHRGGFRYHS